MKYMLLVGLYFKKYKNEFRLKVYVDDHYLDEIVIEDETLGREIQCSKEEWRQKVPFLHPDKHVTGETLRRFPNKIFCYEIDSHVLTEKITFEMNDRNSDYTNHFMTKSNMIMFDEIFLFPKDLLKHFNFQKFIKIWSRIYYYRGNYNTQLLWPGTETLWDGVTPVDIRSHWLGGVKKLHIPIIKKFGMCVLSPDKNLQGTKKYMYTVNSKIVSYLELCNLLNIHDESQ